MSKTELSAHELELLKTALPYAQEFSEKEGRLPYQEEYRVKLGCAGYSAKNIQHYIVETNAVKVAAQLTEIPERAEARNVTKFALGEELQGTSFGYLVRQNALLRAQVARIKFKQDAAKEAHRQWASAEIESLKDAAKAEIKRVPTKASPVHETGLMLEVSLFDAHFGKLAWPNETSGVPYDLKVAQTMFMRAIDKLIERARHYKYELILFPIGNDLLHANDVDSKTVHGTVVDSEGRFQKTYWTVRKTLTEAIEKLKELGPVKVVTCMGNHDKTAVWTLADSLECWFHSDPSVTFDNSPMYRKYQEWGRVGLLFTHGDLGHREDYPLLFATEQPELFGRTKFREVHTGHLHTTKNQEFHGVRVRILGALTPADEWHSSNGYVGNLRTAEAFVWSKEEGLIATFTYTDEAYPTIITKRDVLKGQK
jgi:hypothetical protein